MNLLLRRQANIIYIALSACWASKFRNLKTMDWGQLVCPLDFLFLLVELIYVCIPNIFFFQLSGSTIKVYLLSGVVLKDTNTQILNYFNNKKGFEINIFTNDEQFFHFCIAIQWYLIAMMLLKN